MRYLLDEGEYLPMRSIALALLLGAALASGNSLSQAQTTDTKQTKQQTGPRAAAKPSSARTAPTKRASTRVVVTKRSYLDAGTEVLPDGTQYYNTVVYPPGYNAWKSNNIDPMNSYMSPPDPFWLPGSR
jgi:hypothetical protein